MSKDLDLLHDNDEDFEEYNDEEVHEAQISSLENAPFPEDEDDTLDDDSIINRGIRRNAENAENEDPWDKYRI